MSHAPSDALSRRHDALRGALRAESLTALVVTSLPNITYLTNFTGSAAIVVLTDERVFFLTDSRYVTVVGDMRDAPWACPGHELIVVSGSYDAALATLLTERIQGRVGFEAAHLSVSRFRWLEATLGRTSGGSVLAASEGLVEAARIVKDAWEIDVLREAGHRLSTAAERVLQGLRIGQSERDVAFAIEARIREVGFSRPAFETIVASGPNAARPHARPTERTFDEGDLVVLDFGGCYDSYCVDLTRTVVIGRASARSRQVYDAVRMAHDLAIQAVRPGQSRYAVDAAARDWLTAAGLGEAFGHGTGHGLGIEVHEDPRIARRRPEADRPDEGVSSGMVFTIEPGAYFPGWGGVRIEDDVLVTETGAELLTHVTTELLEIN